MGDKKNKKNKKNYYLVDYENVHKVGLSGIEELKSSDSVYIFYSANADSLSFELHNFLKATKAKVDYIKVDTEGKNALDFQLSSYIGYLIGRDEHCKCYIVSNDRGYNNVKDFWAKRDAKIRMISCIKSQTDSAVIKKAELLEALRELPLTETEKNTAADIVRKNIRVGASQLPQLKININNELIHTFGTEKTKMIYYVIKPLIK